MKNYRTPVTVGVLVCTFILVIGIFTAGAVEICWLTPESETVRIDFRQLNNGNWLLNGFLTRSGGQVGIIFIGSGRVVGNAFLSHLTGSGPPGETEYGTWSGTVIMDLSTYDATVEGIDMRADRVTYATELNYEGPFTLTRIPCP